MSVRVTLSMDTHSQAAVLSARSVQASEECGEFAVAECGSFAQNSSPPPLSTFSSSLPFSPIGRLTTGRRRRGGGDRTGRGPQPISSAGFRLVSTYCVSPAGLEKGRRQTSLCPRRACGRVQLRPRGDPGASVWQPGCSTGSRKILTRTMISSVRSKEVGERDGRGCFSLIKINIHIFL